MKKLLSLILALIMMLSCFSVFAEDESADESVADSAAETETTDESAGESAGETAVTEETSAQATAAAEAVPMAPEHDVIPADEATGQVALSYRKDVVSILDVDGLKFKDMNKNGQLDVYEDWRQDIDARIADLLSQMTLEEKVGLLFQTQTNGNADQPAFTEQLLYEMNSPFAITEGGDATYYSVSYFVNTFKINSFLDNSNGTVAEMVDRHNAIQSVAENTRLSVPATLSCDREYNVWGGYMDIARSAFGQTENTELAAKLWKTYGEAMSSIGYHVILNPTAAQLTSANGEDPERVAEMAALEVASVQSGNIETCAKHFIFGAYSSDRSTAAPIENQAYTWQAVIDAGTGWIMNNYGKGLDGDCLVDYDAETMCFLRETLGFEGVVMTDGWTLGTNNDLSGNILEDGTDANTLTTTQRYKVLLENGVDLFLGITVGPETEYNGNLRFPNFPNAIVAGVNSGEIDIALVERAATRILRSKFKLGQFENPYSDLAYALSVNCSDEYIADPWPITNTEELRAARNPEVVALEEQLMAESAVLIKNDGALLPLKADSKVCFVSNNAANQPLYSAALTSLTTIVATMEEADIVLVDATSMDDSAELAIEDAKAAGKQLIVVCNNAAPTSYVVANADAVLYLNYTNTPDHGTAQPGDFLYLTKPNVYAKLLCGESEPKGVTAIEIARDGQSADWTDLASDTGVDPYVRLMLLGTMKQSATYSVPSNWSDPLIGSDYGMRYGEEADFAYEALILPTSEIEVVTESNGSASTEIQTVETAKAGENFTAYVLLWNNGADGITTVQVKDGDAVIAEKIMALNGGTWRVVQIDVTLDTPGEHTITVGTITKTLTVSE